MSQRGNIALILLSVLALVALVSVVTAGLIYKGIIKSPFMKSATTTATVRQAETIITQGTPSDSTKTTTSTITQKETSSPSPIPSSQNPFDETSDSSYTNPFDSL